MSIKNLKPNFNAKTNQGYFRPINESKYIGDKTKCIFRSNWERIFMDFCDKNPAIVAWSSEPVGIPYLSSVDNRHHFYYVDFVIKIKDSEGNFTNWLVEVKPLKDTQPPKPLTGNLTGKKLAAYERAVKTYLTNKSKFIAAKSYAEKRGMKFGILTEKNGNFNITGK